jgi:enoyl-[acyl-carrier-protein] reductase (NADH)
MELLIELLIWFAIAYMLARMATTWLLNYLTKELRAEIEDFASRLESGKLIPVTVEVDQNQYFCYNALTKDFVCQGYTLKEIAERFSARFPEGKLAIYNGDETAVQTLKAQLESVYENSNSK